MYVGRRYQRGGNILTSVARIASPVAKRFLMESLKATPGVVADIVAGRSKPGEAILSGLKKAGVSAAKRTLGMRMSDDQRGGPAKKRRRKRTIIGKRRKQKVQRKTPAIGRGRGKKSRDIFS